MKRYRIVIFVLAMALAGCASQAPPAEESGQAQPPGADTELEEATEAPPTATHTATASATPVPTATFTPTPTFTPHPDDLDEGLALGLAPGLAGRYASKSTTAADDEMSSPLTAVPPGLLQLTRLPLPKGVNFNW